MLGALPKIFLRVPVTPLGRHQGRVLWDRGGLLGQKSGDLVRTIFHFTTDHFPLYYGLVRTRTDGLVWTRTDAVFFLNYGLVRTRTDESLRVLTSPYYGRNAAPNYIPRVISGQASGVPEHALGWMPDVGWGRWDARWLTSGLASALAAGTSGDP